MPSRTPPPRADRHPWARTAHAAWVAAMLVALWAPTPRGGGFLPPGSDKVVHALLFAVLTVLARLRGASPGRALVEAAVLAVVSEVGQALADDVLFGPLGLPPAGRTADPWDAMADLAGAAMGLGVVRRRAGAGARRNGRDSNPR